MKDQYFGDVNDFCKYGLLRALTHESSMRLLVTWMLTPKDETKHGQEREWLSDPTRWRAFDPILFDGLTSLLADGVQPDVKLIEQTDLLEKAYFDRELVPIGRVARLAWRERLIALIKHEKPDLVYIDPDTGIEVPTYSSIGTRHSPGYVYWNEIEQIWACGCSLLIFQYFPRNPNENHTAFAARIQDELMSRIGAPMIRAFSTKKALFLLAAQDRHTSTLAHAIEANLCGWRGQINQEPICTARGTLVTMSQSTQITSERAPEPVGPYPHARRVGDLVYVSGLGPRQRGSKTIPGVTLDEAGNAIAHDIEAQCHSVFANIKMVLEDAGSSFDRIVDVLVFLTDMKGDFQAFNRVYGEYFAGDGKPNPTRTTVEVTALPTPIAIELKVIATI